MILIKYRPPFSFTESTKATLFCCLGLYLYPTFILAQTQNIGANPLDKSAIVSSPFGIRSNPFTGEHEQHDGLDIPSQAGSPILATGDGKVIYAGYAPGYGNLVEIDHGQGYSTRYGHAQTLLVKTGDLIKQSQVIATVGSTGRSTGPHLHFEVSFKGTPFDPLILLGSQYARPFSHNSSILIFTSSKLKAPSQLSQYAKGNGNPQTLYTSSKIKASGQPYVIVRSHIQRASN
jgi:murein DD-endopeptidase MepM/ murein hydrolase activator NlpD